MEVIQTNKGGLKVILEGHMYTKHATRKTKIWWKCVKRLSMSCRGSIITDLQNGNPEVKEPHNHPSDEKQISLTKVRLQMKQQASQTRDKPSQIFAQVVADCDNDVQAMLPDHDTCKRTMRNQRPTPPVPGTLSELGTIPEEFSKTTSGDPFLIYDNGANNPNRILAYASTNSLKRLAQADTIFMDGTFKTSPCIFTQIFTMRVPFRDTSITAVYALLPNKTRAVYEELFQAVVDKIEELGLDAFVETVVTDFEDGILRSVVAVFGRDVTTRGCFYHLTQSAWRRVQDLGLVPFYKESNEFRLFCGMLDGLALLPLDEVQEGIEHLHSIKPDGPAEIDDLVTYFERMYVKGHYRQRPGQGLTLNMRRVPPMFPPEVWNVHEATLNNAACTNICEGWNHKFFNLVGQHHPNIWRVVEWFKNEDATVQTIIAQDVQIISLYLTILKDKSE